MRPVAIRAAVALAAVVLLLACGGSVTPPLESASEACAESSVTYADTETVPMTATGEADSVELPCHDGEALVSGGCAASEGGAFVSNAAIGNAWACAITAADDHVVLTLSVTCRTVCPDAGD